MELTKNIVDNVDLEKLEGFRSFLQENPDKGKLKLQVEAIYEKQVGRSIVHIGPYELDGQKFDRKTRHYTIPFGAWREVEEALGVEGPTDRMEPVEMAMAATAACVVNSISYNTVRLGIPIEGLEIAVRSTIDPRVLFAVREIEDHVPCLGTIEYEVKVKGDVSNDDIETIKKLCKHSPVYGLLAEPIQMKAIVSRA